jgi:serine/threonine protein kinase
VAEEDDDRGQIVPQDPDAQWKQGFDVPPQKGTLRGTPSVIAPEGFLGVPVTSKSDIYALGVILYEMLSGYVPVNRPFEYQKGVPIRIPDFVRGVYEFRLHWNNSFSRCLCMNRMTTKCDGGWRTDQRMGRQ